MWLEAECLEAPGRLRCVSLEARGSFTALIGPNGSGKTSLLLAILGALRLEGGSVRAPRRLGYSPQNPYLSFHKATVVEELESSAGSRGEAARLLREAGLWSAAERSPLTLSLGEARLLSVLVALAWGPEALLLDEPTAGLGAAEAGRLAALLEESGVPVLAATHDAVFAAAMAEWVAVMDKGRVVWQGPPEGAGSPLGGVDRCIARCMLGLD